MALDFHEANLLLYLESCAVDHGGLVDTQLMNNDDLIIIEKWTSTKYVEYGRLASESLFLEHGSQRKRTYWVTLSEQAWQDAHTERRARYERMNKIRNWKKNTEKTPKPKSKIKL